jgi:hypothetical protein
LIGELVRVGESVVVDLEVQEVEVEEMREVN